MWRTILNGIKRYTTPQGHALIQQIIATIKDFEKALTADNNPSLSALYAKIGILYNELAKTVQNNPELTAALSFTGKECVKMGLRLKANTAHLTDVANFIKIAAHKIRAASFQIRPIEHKLGKGHK